MAKIKVTNPKQIINGGAKKYYFKVKGVGGIKGDKGDKGDTGSQGPQGPQGNAATIEVGSTTTLPTGYDATVTNTGTINNAILNFGIPRGIKGDTGAKGDKGDKGDKGEQGNTGPQGPAGQNATVYVGTTTTGAAGTQASVYNSGTDRNAVLNFTIPQGAKGDTGATGATGPQGPAGQDGQNFTPTIVETLPATGDQSKLYLTPKDYTTGTATGNPITISLGEDAGQITSAQLDGDTYQQSYTGKNLFDKDSVILGKYINSSGEIDNTPAWCVSAYIKISPSTNYTISGQAIAGSATRSCYYTANKEVISVFTGGNKTITTPSNAEYMRVSVFTGNQDTSSDVPTYMLELGSSATSYEPYCGGVPSPNPDYPQQIQTVTGEQTVTIVGKNLFDTTNADIREQYILNDSGVEVSDRSGGYTRNYSKVVPETTYILSGLDTIGGKARRVYYYDKDKTFISRSAQITTGSPTLTFTTPVNCYFVNIQIFYPNDTDTSAWQLELGSTASSYAPYSKQTLPISLGSIELCKLGTYQDYIYKSGSDWKVHKATGKKTFSDGSSFFQSGRTTSSFLAIAVNLSELDSVSLANNSFAKATHFRFTGATSENGGMDIYNGSTYAQNFVCYFDRTAIPDLSTARSWITEHKPQIVYVRYFVTDTTITDTNLIAQLEAVRNATLQASNTITNAATGTNLAGDLELGYCEYDPQNRYDKWLWLDLNNNYEQMGS